MNTQECCNHNCNQGRDCPLRKKDESFDRTASHMDGEYVSHRSLAEELTDEEIWKLWVKHLNDDIVVFAREILKKASEK